MSRARRPRPDDKPEVREMLGIASSSPYVTPAHDKLPDCGWCGLRIATTTVHATPACRECAKSNKARVTAYLQRMKRAAG